MAHILNLREHGGQYANYITERFVPGPSPTRRVPAFLFMPPFSDSSNTSVHNDARLRLVLGQPSPFQYLSRAHLPHGPMPAVTLNPQGPIAAVAEAVSRAWQRQGCDELMVLSPTFSSSPQSVYYGQTVLPDGQVLHRSTSMNVFRVFQDLESGLPVTMTGHEFIFHLACPEDQHTLWNLEAPYPTDAQMQGVMRRFVPPVVAGAVALTFPMHGTGVAPPMLPMDERLRLDAVSTLSRSEASGTNLLKGPAGHGSAAEVLREQLTAVEPDQLNTTNLAKLPRGLAVPTPRGLMGSGQEARQVIANFEEQLYRRARKTLQLDKDYFVTYQVEDTEDTSTTSGSGMPDLVSATSDGGGSNSSINVGLCDLCLAPQHDSVLECPRLGTNTEEGGLGMGHLMSVLTGEQLIQKEEIKLTQDEGDAESFPSAATLNDHEGEEEFATRETHHVPATGDAAFRTLVDAAVDARKMLEECTVEYDEETEGEGKNRNGTIVLANADQTGSGIRIRPATPFSPSRSPLYLPPRHETPEPEDRHSDDGSPVLRRHASAPPSHADRVTVPFFSRRGRVITRDTWSSSPASLAGRQLLTIEENERTATGDRLETLPRGEWSPAESEGSVDFQSSYPLQWLIEEALYRAWGWPSSYPPSYATDSESSTNQSSDSRYSGFSCTSRYEFLDDGNYELHDSLSFWVREGNAHQREHRRFENEMGAEPLHQALQTLYGPLSFFVDYFAMAGQGVKEIVTAVFPSCHTSVFSAAGGASPTPVTQSTPEAPHSPAATFASDPPLGPLDAFTSLDRSLPAATPATVTENITEISAGSDGEWEDIVQPLGSGTRKRKRPEDEEEGLDQQGRRKKTRKFLGDALRRTVIKREAHKAAGMADERTIRLMAGVRLAVLEALRRIEDMVWHRYGISEVRLRRAYQEFANCFRDFRHQYAFPDKLIRHPFLFPLEAAKLQVLWHILQRNGRDVLADTVHEVLSIRLHKDYAVAAFFTAASLDENYPERDWDYWYLLGEEYPQSLYLRHFDIDNSSDSGSMGGLEYPPGESGTALNDDNSAGIGHHEPCRDFNGAGPITLTISLRSDAVPDE
ncbi:hypothetical protein K438DRAFT_2092856 [Mycena galopus ATCC 62051]|nr:hypothetical protein K438DRAFT_2092856 [Mycena galopus ATCC 62051]